MFNGSTDSCFQLNHFNPGVFDDFMIDNDVEIELLLLKDAFNGPGRYPNIISIEDSELFDGSEVALMFRGYLSDFKETDLTVVIDDGTTLDIGLGLIRDFHNELGSGLDHVFEDGGIDRGT